MIYSPLTGASVSCLISFTLPVCNKNKVPGTFSLSLVFLIATVPLCHCATGVVVDVKLNLDRRNFLCYWRNFLCLSTKFLRYRSKFLCALRKLLLALRKIRLALRNFLLENRGQSKNRASVGIDNFLKKC